jgi:predicted MFS family arabinose efflux permease
LPAWLIGAATSIGMFLAILGALGSPRLARRRGSEFAMLLASASLGGGLLLMGAWPNAFTAQLGAISTLSLSAVFVPSYQVLQMEAVAPEWRSLVAGVGSMAMSLGYGTVSLTGGHIVSSQGYARLFQLGACLALLSAALMWRLVRRPGLRALAAQIPGGSLSVVDVAPGAQGRSDVD